MPEPTDKSVPQVLTELWDLVKTYARQEVVEPLKGVGRYLGFGLGGAILGSIGVVLLLLALLRALQTQTGTALTGSWSWAPYGIVFVISALLILLAVSRISKKQGQT